MTNPLLITADWGTSSFRAFLVGGNAEVFEKKQAPLGIMKVENKDFAGIFTQLLKDWLSNYPNIPVLMSGMIGSEQGWSLAPHVKLPAGNKELAAALHPVRISTGRTGYIIPGLKTVGSSGIHDIMRGEETQIVGGFKNKWTNECVLCLPGTHSKWVILKDGVVTNFQTSMTGEVIDVLAGNSILSRLMEDHNIGLNESFAKGINRSIEIGGLLHHLFAVRSQGFIGKVPKRDLKTYLAGILIGHEIKGMMEIYPKLDSITIIGGAKVLKIYEKAFDIFSVDTQLLDGDIAAIQGHLMIAKIAGLIR